MSVICVTGQMAAGKNYICSQMEKEGWSSIDADILVHQAIKIAKDQIIEAFLPTAESAGLKIISEDGQINRRQLGQLLFANPDLLKKQESIVYPIIEKQIDDFINHHEKTIINATVLYKTPALLYRCDYILFVTAPFFTRLKRARKRDKLPYKQIIRRFMAQSNLLKEYKKSGKEIKIIRNV